MFLPLYGERCMTTVEYLTSATGTYVGLTVDGAKWLVENTDIKLIGVDYLAVAVYEEAIPIHHVFLRGREIILVEGLKHDGVLAGLYSVHCLPLRLMGSDGSPARCIPIR
ncbi:unnamed protein product [Prunus brigantina]